MTREEAINRLTNTLQEMRAFFFDSKHISEDDEKDLASMEMAIEALEHEECEDAVSRQAVCNIVDAIRDCISVEGYWAILERLKKLPSVNPQKIGHCKDCKYFEYDSLAKVDGVKLIFAHEICKRWGDGCKTSEEGFCFLFEPQESEEEE